MPSGMVGNVPKFERSFFNMKKLIALAIAAIMVLSMIPVMAFTASAEGESNFPEKSDGFWSVWRWGNDYDDPTSYCPAPGYKYTSEGFTTIAPDYTNHTPGFTVQTSNPVDLKQGFYMQVRIDEFAYDGGEGKDEWISFHVADTPLVTLGNITFNNNWCTLNRGTGNGTTTVQNFNTIMTDEEAGVNGAFNIVASPSVTVPMDEDGREIYDLEIKWTGSAYEIYVCDTLVSVASNSDHILTFEETYVGMSIQTGVANEPINITILKQGTSKADATTPTGDDEGTPEENVKNFAEIIDSSTIEANQPALLWDGHKTTYSADPNNSASNMILTPTGDYTYHAQATGTSCYFGWGIKSALSYEAQDFPIFVMMLKNYMGNDGGLYYTAGEIMANDNNHTYSWSLWSDDSKIYEAGDDEYSFVVCDLSESADWAGRIHGIRPDFATDPSDEEYSQWDIEFMAFFRSVEEAQTYADEYIRNKGIDPDATQPEETEPETDPETDPETNEQGTTADTTDGTTAGTEGEDKTDDTTGCASVIGFGSVAVLAAAAAFVALKKKD